MLKWFSLPALAVLASLAMAPAASAASGYTTGDVNMRTGPGTRYHRILTIPRGAPVEIYGCSGSWCDTFYAGRRGWVSGHYLSTAQYYDRGPGVAPGAAAAGIIGLGVAGAILADRWDDNYYWYRGHRYPRNHWHHPRPRPWSGPRPRPGWHPRGIGPGNR